MALSIPSRLAILAALALLAIGWITLVSFPMTFSGSHHGAAPEMLSKGAVTAPEIQAPPQTVQRPVDSERAPGPVQNGTPAQTTAPPPGASQIQSAPPAVMQPAGEGSSEHCAGVGATTGVVKHPPIVACLGG